MLTPVIIAHHLIWTGYGQWLSNDPRGSGSTEIRKPELGDLGPIHFGRKRVQPSRRELREFYQRAEPLLDHEAFWIDSAKRQALSGAFEEIIKLCGYTLYALAICSNHMHGCIRRHRDDADTMWRNIAGHTRDVLRRLDLVSADDPVWSDRPYAVFLHTPDEVWRRIQYIELNPKKEGLARQFYKFVVPYDGWPLHRRRKR